MRPTGWFQVAWSAEIPVGGVKPLKYFGRHLVAYRTESGAVVVLDAHCLHLGAHLGYGGKVCGESIACPYHGWEWDPSGANVRIPYMSRPRPSQKRLQSWHVREQHELILIWHDPAGGPPRWEPPNVFEDLPNEQWPTAADCYPAYPDAIQHFPGEPVHPQLTMENAVDSIHFRYVHAAPADPVLLEWEAGEHRWRSEIGFRSVRSGEIAMSSSVLASGVGIALNQFTGRQNYRLAFCTTPVDDETSDLFLAFWLPRDPGDTGDRIPESKATLLDYLKSSLPDDIRIWANQVYVERPMFAEQDARPYSELRQWVKRFYEVPPQLERAPRASNSALA